MSGNAFVNISARHAVTSKAISAGARKTAHRITARSRSRCTVMQIS